MSRARHGAATEPAEVADPVELGLAALERDQSPEGCWSGDYSGPLFLLPIYVAALHILDRPPGAARRARIERTLRAQQNPDGGFGLDVEGPSLVFTSVLCTVALRLLGAPPDDPAVRAARRWFLARGGATASASWGKFILALLGLYEYDGLHPVPPEAWLLPRWLPVHPGRLWCHCRMVYLPMSWLYARRARGPVTPLIRALREEIYCEPYDTIDWRACRGRVAPSDAHTPATRPLRILNRALGLAERRVLVRARGLRRRALDEVLRQIDREDRNTDYICIGPVNKLLNTVVWHFARPGGPELARHLPRLEDYLTEDAHFTRMKGYNSSELWDTAFAVQAIFATGRAEEHRGTLQRAFTYIEQNQVRADVADPAGCYRHPSRGGWPFSNRAHGWPISDCTAEGLKASLLLEPLVAEPLEPARLREAAELILSLQNRDGSWSTYEPARGPAWLEALNPSDCFGRIMIDHPHVECTSACVQALVAFRRRLPGAHRLAIDTAIRRGAQAIGRMQRPDGSWEGSWGICFTYGTWFGVWGLRAAGVSAEDPRIARACDFLEAHQRADGAWGEALESCARRCLVPREAGHSVMTAWAILAPVDGVRPWRAGWPSSASARSRTGASRRRASRGSSTRPVPSTTAATASTSPSGPWRRPPPTSPRKRKGHRGHA